MPSTRATGRGDKALEEEFLHQLYRGGELLAAGKVIEAKDHLEKAFSLQPKNEKGQNLLGLTYFKLGLFDRASEIYETLVRENPADPTLRVNLGLVYLKTNGLQRAIREFETATDLAPEHKKAHNYLGLALAQAGEYGRAREHFVEAGSEAMAAKMAKAIAGEGLPKPVAQPSLARQPGFAEIEGGAEGQSESWSEPQEEAKAEAAAPVEEVPSDLPAPGGAPQDEVQIEVMSDEEMPPPESGEELEKVDAPAGAQALAAPLGADWGAQFGLDGEAGQKAPAAANDPQPAVEPEVQVSAPVGAPAEDELRMAADEGPSAQAEEIEVSMEDAAAAPPPEEKAAPKDADLQDEAADAMARMREAADGKPVLEANAEDIVVVDEPKAPEPKPVELPRALRLASAPEEGSRTADVIQHPSVAARAATSVAPVFAPGVAAPLVELGQGVRLLAEPLTGPFHVSDELVAMVVQGELLARLDGLVAWTGSMAFVPERKRFRGKATEKPFGEGAARMTRVTGNGVALVEASDRTFLPVDLDDESGYFREAVVFAFEEAVAFENGRVPSEVPPDLDLVHLRGKGKVLLVLEGPVRSLEVKMDAPVTVPLAHLAGWHGQVTPKVVPIAWDEAGKVVRTAVELSGEGFALFSMPVA
ncbi:MAG: tetratricopeptide repeat protein [Myxococcaceae bacterium]